MTAGLDPAALLHGRRPAGILVAPEFSRPGTRAVPGPLSKESEMANVTLGGNPIELAGKFPQKGDTAPPLSLVGADLADVTLDKYAGKRKVLNIVPSLDTPT